MESHETYRPFAGPASVPTGDVAGFLQDSRAELVALAYLLTGSRDQAQDVVHDVFVRVLRTDTSRVSNMWAYARRAVCNEAASWGRSVARRARRNRPLRAEWVRDLDTRPDPFGRVELMSALPCLFARQRSAVVIRYYSGLDDG